MVLCIYKQIIFADKSLTIDEKSNAIKLLYDELNRICFNKGKRICEICQQECIVALYYCKYCIRNYFKKNF